MRAWCCMAAGGWSLLAGAEADLWLLWRWSRTSHRGLDRALTERLRCRPWRPVDAALLLAMVVLLALPALSLTLHPERAGTILSTTALFVQALLSYAIVGAGFSLAAWRTGAGCGALLGIERHTLAAGIRSGLIYGLATVPPVLLAAWGVATVLKACGVSAPAQAVFDWLGDQTLPLAARVFLIVAAIVLAPLTEELIFRGALLPALLRRHSTACALLLLNLLFALLHFNAAAFLPLFVAGICFSLGFLVTGSVVTPIIMHAVFNGEMLLLFIAFPQLASAT